MSVTTTAERAYEVGEEQGAADARAWLEWEPSYEHWRHGGWYVSGTRYPNGGCGCISRQLLNPTTGKADRKWRIVCDPRAGDFTYRTRDEAARAEHRLCIPTSRLVGDHYDAWSRRTVAGVADGEMADYLRGYYAARDGVLRPVLGGCGYCGELAGTLTDDCPSVASHWRAA